MATAPSPLTVRLVRIEAAMHKLVAALHASCFEDSWNAYTVGQVMRMPGAFGVLALISRPGGGPDVPVGFAMASGAHDERELLSIGVLRDYRRAGIGRELVSSVIDQATASGAARLFLEVAEDNLAAQNLYRAYGFLPVGRRPGYYRRKAGPPVAALTLRRNLRPPSVD